MPQLYLTYKLRVILSAFCCNVWYKKNRIRGCHTIQQRSSIISAILTQIISVINGQTHRIIAAFIILAYKALSSKTTCMTKECKRMQTFGRTSKIMSTTAASWYSFQAFAFFSICSASALAFASIANASASPFIYITTFHISATETTDNSDWYWATFRMQGEIVNNEMC